MHPTKTLILRVLKKNGEQTTKQICSEMPGMSIGSIRTAMNLMFSLKLVAKRSAKESSKPNLIFWRIR